MVEKLKEIIFWLRLTSSLIYKCRQFNNFKTSTSNNYILKQKQKQKQKKNDKRKKSETVRVPSQFSNCAAPNPSAKFVSLLPPSPKTQIKCIPLQLGLLI